MLEGNKLRLTLVIIVCLLLVFGFMISRKTKTPIVKEEPKEVAPAPVKLTPELKETIKERNRQSLDAYFK